MNPAELDEAERLMQSGIGAFQSGRLADAIRHLQQTRDQLRPLLRANPGDRRLASRLGLCLQVLGVSLRDSDRPVEALASFQESLGVLEAIIDPGPGDLYNLACCYSQLSLLSDHAATPATFLERVALADRAMDALRRAVAAGFSDFGLMDRDKDLDPLRGRADFKALVLDRGFPPNPFAR
jgi:tetratricopeptide (TPR) repeat protein